MAHENTIYAMVPRRRLRDADGLAAAHPAHHHQDVAHARARRAEAVTEEVEELLGSLGQRAPARPQLEDTLYSES